MKRRNEVLVGVLLTVATLVAVAGTIWLVRGGLRSGYPLYAVFNWGANLKVGQPVRLAGVQVGYVADVDLRDNGTLLMTMKIGDYRIPQGAVATVTPVGLFGDAEVQLIARPNAAKIAERDTIPAGVPPAGIAEVTAKADSVASVAVNVTKSFQSQMVDSGGLNDLRQTIASTNALVQQLSAVVLAQSRQLTLTQSQLRRTIAAVDSTSVDSTVRNLNLATRNAAALTDSLRVTTGKLNATLAQLQSGNGTVGKLLSDTLLYQDVRHLVGRLDSLTVDLQKNPRKYVTLRVF